jgi:hypothetical protein
MPGMRTSNCIRSGRCANHDIESLGPAGGHHYLERFAAEHVDEDIDVFRGVVNDEDACRRSGRWWGGVRTSRRFPLFSVVKALGWFVRKDPLAGISRVRHS